MQLTVIGCSPAWPNPGGAQSGYLVEDSGRLLLDCGPGVLARLRQREPWPTVEAIVISHLHLDHCGDLFPWIIGVVYGPSRDADLVELWLPPEGKAELLELAEHLGAADHLASVFALRAYAEGEPFRAAGFELTAAPVPHYHESTFALRVRNGSHTLTYSGDCAPSPQLVELARDADLFLCEATLDEPEPDLRGHMTAAEAVEASERAHARRLVVVHRPDELPLPAGIERAHDGWSAIV